jgi:hypothetical protein
MAVVGGGSGAMGAATQETTTGSARKTNGAGERRIGGGP